MPIARLFTNGRSQAVRIPKDLEFKGTNQVTISWSSVAGKRYRVQYKESANATIWHNLLGDVNSTNTLSWKVDRLSNTDLRFYRVLLVP